MNSIKLTAFALLVALIGVGAAAVGRATNATPPFGAADTASGHGAAMELTLRPERRSLAAGRTVSWRFRVVDADGRTVRRFEREQAKLLHLILVRSDLTGYQHLHPRLGPDGAFTVPIEVDRPGRYRAIADFTSGDERHAIGTDLRAPGRAAQAPLPPPATLARTDGYLVRLSRPPTLRAGSPAALTFKVSRDGRAVRGLRPYLGAYGHLVALHAPDLDYSHVHPVGEDLARASVSFEAELAEAGSHRLFFQFRAGGRAHTAAFTQIALPAAGPAAAEEHHDH